MKVKKYLLAGVLTLSLSAPVFGQEVSYQEALKPIAAALNADPNNPKAAKDLVKDYLKEYKKDADAIVGLGTIYLQVHNFEKAQEMADLVLANKKMNQSNAYMLLGDIAALQDSVGNAGAAATQYQTAISIDPQNVLAYERYARVYRHVSPETAVKKLEELRQVKPDYPVEVKAAEIMLADQKYAEAAKWFAKAPKTQLDETAYYQYIVAEFYSGNAKNALEVARHGLQKYAGSEYLSRLAVMAAVDQNQFPEALTYSENVMRGKEQKNYNDYYYYGQALAGNDKFQEAINAYNKCLELKPGEVDPLSKLSAAYAGLGDGDKALDFQRQYLEKGTNITSTDWADFAGIYIKMGDQVDSLDHAKAVGYYTQAMDVYEKMTEKFPTLKDWCWVAEASVALGKLKDLDKVRDLYMKVAEYEEAKADKSDANTKNYLVAAYYFLGYYYAGKNDAETSKSYFEKLIQIDPENAEAKKALGLE
uniref:tetratricopeptide repeat protein n=1 Tax=Prevotella sp. TaxID=59823 RepID=UPI004029A9EE